MNNTIIIKKINKSKNKIDYEYEIDGTWAKYFNMNEKFFVEFDKEIENLNDSIAIIPLITNLLPISWIFNGTIICEELDDEFYKNIKKIKKGYIDMYPKINFSGNLVFEKLIKNNLSSNTGCISFFSGGVDAYNTLIEHINEKPMMLSVWGADVKLNDSKGWQNVYNNLINVSNEFNLELCIIRSNFRSFINTLELDYYSYKYNENWWHGFQHGIGLIGLCAPIAYLYRKTKIYFASSFCYDDKEKVTCASDPTIDNNLKFSTINVIHDGYNYTRQDKVHNIVEFHKKSKKKIELRVCWQDNSGDNCCRCEKCMRTIIELFAENVDPREFGINYTEKDLKMSKKIYQQAGHMSDGIKKFYKFAQEKMKINTTYDNIPEGLKWFYNTNTDKLDYHPFYYFYYRCKRKIKNLLRKEPTNEQ